MKKEWYQQKTTWTGISAVIAAIASFFTGSADLMQALQVGFPGLLAIFLRQGVEKK